MSNGGEGGMGQQREKGIELKPSLCHSGIRLQISIGLEGLKYFLSNCKQGPCFCLFDDDLIHTYMREIHTFHFEEFPVSFSETCMPCYEMLK